MRRLGRLALRSGLLLVVLLVMLRVFLAQPTWRGNRPSELQVEPDRLRSHVEKLSVDFHPRNGFETDNLDRAADWIGSQFAERGGEVRMQSFQLGRRKPRTYRNVRALYGEGKGRKLIIGAHYDSCADTPGADDNASGVAGLLELAGLIEAGKPERELELVAYTLEEPPFYGSEDMGSYVHAQRAVQEGEQIEGVLVLEMIGYFDDRFGSQRYPAPLLHLLYPNRGNFIVVAGILEHRAFVGRIKTGMKGSTPLRVESISAPRSLPGIDFSDHRNYWPHGIPAVMVTDTAFYRNTAYHQLNDVAGRLDYERMSDVVVAVYEAIVRDLQLPPSR